VNFRVQGTEEYLHLLATEAARGVLSSADFQGEVAKYVRDNPELADELEARLREELGLPPMSTGSASRQAEPTDEAPAEESSAEESEVEAVAEPA